MIYNKICLMLPTYGRSKNLLPTFILSALNTAKNRDNLCFAFCVNGNDADTINFLKSGMIASNIKCKIVKENLPAPNLAVYFNMLYDATEDYGDDCLVTMMGDDMEFKTPGWDEKILALVNQYDGVGTFWCNDDFIAHERMCVNMFVTRKMVRATEHKFMDETFSADMIDFIWYEIGKITKSLHYLSDVVIKHNHSTGKPKNEWDDTFNRLRIEQHRAHKIGKDVARKLVFEISNILIRKGFTGDNT